MLNWQEKDAASQLEFLKEVGPLQAPDLLYLQGLLGWKHGQDLSQVMLDYYTHFSLDTPAATGDATWFQGMMSHVTCGCALPRLQALD